MQRQTNEDRTAAPPRTLDPDGTAEVCDDLAARRKANTAPGFTGAVGASEVGFEHFVQLVLRNAGPVVRHRDEMRIRTRRCANTDAYLRLLGVPNRISDQVVEQSVKRSTLAVDGWQGLKVNLYLRRRIGKTELVWTFYGFADDDAELSRMRQRQSNLAGPAGYISMEDGCVGGFVQRGIAGAEDERSVVQMGGEGAETQATRATETSVRGFWKAYRPLMGL